MRRERRVVGTLLAVALAVVAGCAARGGLPGARTMTSPEIPSRNHVPARPIEDRATPKARRMAEAAASQVGRTVRYDPAYVQLRYPGGDVPIDRGVCTDVVVRAMRQVGVDLQVAVHEDMSRHFAAYPHRWGLGRPDPNIDHRRVPNLQTYFQRKGKSLPVSTSEKDYRPGDVVAWDIGAGTLHMGVVSRQRSEDGRRFRIVHNIGAGTRVEDRLFDWRVVGHYRPL